MTFARSRIDSHNAGTCDPRTCPVCLDERAERGAVCEPCGAEPAATCDHGVTVCDDCDDDGACVLCQRERTDDIAEDMATERALDEWRGLS